MTRPAHARSNGPAGDAEALRDDVLLDAAHSGDAGAFGVLRERYHGTALAVARSRSGSAEEAERVAAAALGRVEQIVGEGGGPRAFLGAFVVWMVGREADGGTRPVALPDDPADPTSLVRVFSGLPAEWQAFLWRTEVLGHSARRAAAALGLGAVAAAGLHRDMVRGLRGLYGQAAADRAPGPDCAEFSGELPHFVRGTRGQRSRRDVKAHLDGCARCTAEYLSRQDIGTGLRTWTLPVLAGLPLWGTEALELANLIAGAGGPDGAGAATGAAAAGTGAAAGGAALRAGTGPSGARPHGAAGASPWPGRRAKVLLGAGALATAVAVAAVSVSGGGDPVPAPGSLAAEQAPRTAEDLQDARAGDAAARAEQAGDDTAGSEGAAPERDGGSSRSDGAAAEQGPADVPAGALEDGAGPEAAALVAGRDGAAAAAAGASDPAGSDAVARPGAGAQRPASAPGGARSAESGTPGAASPGAAPTGGAARDTSSGASSASTTPARTSEASSSAPAPAQETGAPAPVQEAGTSSPAPSVPSSLPTLEPSAAPLRAPVPPAGTIQPPSSSAGTGTAPGAGPQHVQQRAGGAPGAEQAEPGPRRHGTDWHRQTSQAWKDAGRPGRHLEKGQRGRGGPGDGRQRDHSHR